MKTRSVNICQRSIGPDSPPYIIAELSANHNGSLERALETIDAAQKCGADAIKLQTYSADTMTIDCDAPEFQVMGGLWDGYSLYELYKWAETPYEWHEAMFAHARKLGITVFSTPFDESAVDLLEDLNTPAYKIASFEIVDLPLIRYVAATGKPMIMSTGMASEAEIEEAVGAARDAGCKDLVLLHCISSYPAPMDQANLRQMPKLAERFGTFPGLSDHTMGTVASVAAVALGACVIEKHFTLDRSARGTDFEASLDPDRLHEFCNRIREADASIGLGDPSLMSEAERRYGEAVRKKIVAVRDIRKGEQITRDMLVCLRSEVGLPVDQLDAVVGACAQSDISQFDSITEADLPARQHE